MTIQLLHQYNGYAPGIYSTMGSTEEARLVGLGLARYWSDGIDGKNTVFSEPEKAAGQALVSEAGDFVDLSYLSGWALAAAGPGYLFHDGRTLLHDGQPLASL